MYHRLDCDLYNPEVLGFCDPGQSTVGHLLDAPQASVLPLLLPQKASGLLTKPISSSNSPATKTGSEIGISAQGDIRRCLLEKNYSLSSIGVTREKERKRQNVH